MTQRVLEQHEIERLLRSQRVVRVAFSADRNLYLVPLGYVWLESALYVVTSTGRKTEMATSNGRVAFQLDDSAETGLLGWSSVSGEGVWEVVSEKLVKAKVLAALLLAFPELRKWGVAESLQKGSTGALVFAAIKPLWMTGRAFSPGDGQSTHPQ